jgi:hypothetical protein
VLVDNNGGSTATKRSTPYFVAKVLVPSTGSCGNLRSLMTDFLPIPTASRRGPLLRCQSPQPINQVLARLWLQEFSEFSATMQTRRQRACSVPVPDAHYRLSRRMIEAGRAEHTSDGAVSSFLLSGGCSDMPTSRPFVLTHV